MKAIELYDQLESDFIKLGLSDEWRGMESVADLVTDNFKSRSMGLVCDFSTDIGKVYTAVFPTDEVLSLILESGTQNCLLFVHHPMIWDITKAPAVFHNINKQLLQRLKEREISIYNLHAPLDNYSDYSTSNTLARALGIEAEQKFAEYFGGLCGVIGSSGLSLAGLRTLFEKTVGHEVRLYEYGDQKLTKVAIVAGGGNDLDVLNGIVENGANVLVTGVSAVSDYAAPAHKFAQEHKISIIGGTHYSSEKLACQAMVKYFENLGLDSEFIEGTPGLEDL